MKRAYKLVSGIALVASLGIATAVYAHGGGFGPMGGMGGMGGPQGMPGHMADRASFDPAAMMEGRLAYLKSALKITDQQDAAWQAYSAKAKQQGETMHASRAAMSSQNAGGSVPERMALRTATMQQHLGNMETMNNALKDLYAVLTPEQKAIADRSFGHMRMAFGGQSK